MPIFFYFAFYEEPLPRFLTLVTYTWYATEVLAVEHLLLLGFRRPSYRQKRLQKRFESKFILQVWIFLSFPLNVWGTYAKKNCNFAI